MICYQNPEVGFVIHAAHKLFLTSPKLVVEDEHLYFSITTEIDLTLKDSIRRKGLYM
jgi:hypothetical protein